MIRIECSIKLRGKEYVGRAAIGNMQNDRDMAIKRFLEHAYEKILYQIYKDIDGLPGKKGIMEGEASKQVRRFLQNIRRGTWS